MDDFSKHLAHLVKLAKNPGFKDHAWHRAKEMARLCPELYGAMPSRLTEEMQSLASASQDTSGAAAGTSGSGS